MIITKLSFFELGFIVLFDSAVLSAFPSMSDRIDCCTQNAELLLIKSKRSYSKKRWWSIFTADDTVLFVLSWFLRFSMVSTVSRILVTLRMLVSRCILASLGYPLHSEGSGLFEESGHTRHSEDFETDHCHWLDGIKESDRR